MMSIAAVQSKGGTGKSTVAIHLAVTATHLGYKTVLIDTDVQRSVTNWGKRRSAHTPAIIPVDANALSDRLDMLASDFDLAFVDTPGHDLKALSRAAVSVDLTLIVSRPTRFDVETAIEVRDGLHKFNLPNASLITQAPPRMSTKLAAWAAAYSRQGEVVDTMLTSLMAYQDSITLGLGVEEYEPHGRAAREIRATLEWILRRVKETKR